MINLITSQQKDAVVNLLSAKQNILIFTHQSPDGDAMGSSLGLLHYLHSLGKQATIIVPNRFPHFLTWMPEADKIIVNLDQPEAAKTAMQAADLIFCLDFNEPKRINEAADLLLAAACPIVVLDHHLLNPASTLTALLPDPQIATLISYPEAPAASYLVLELINALIPQLGGELTTDAASCIYCGLMTDTGNFAFNSNNPNLYEMVAQLLRLGINKDKIFDAVFNQYSVDRLRFTGFCLYHKMRIFPKYHTALISLSSEELKRFNFQSGDAEGIVNMPLQIANVYYSCFMREDVDKIKLSFRSQGDRPVNEFAHAFFNGGGHMNAAGGEFLGSLADAVKAFEANYTQFFKKD